MIDHLRIRWLQSILACFSVLVLAASVGCDGGGGVLPHDGGPDAFDVQVPDDPGVDVAVDAGPDVTADVSVDVPAPFEHGGVTASQQNGIVTVDAGRLVLEFDLRSGRFDVRVRPPSGGAPVLVLGHAESRAWYKVAGGQEFRVASSDAGTRTWSAAALDDTMGTGLLVEVVSTPDDGGPELVSHFGMRAEATFLTAGLDILWLAQPAAEPGLRVFSLSPVAADADSGGALFLGPDPATHSVLDNGHDLVFDYEATVRRVGDGMSLLFGPGFVSNWTMAVADTASDAALVAGFFTNRRGVGLIALDYTGPGTPEDAGRRGMDRFEGISRYLDGRAAMAPHPDTGAPYGLTSEIFYADFAPATAQEGLEAFGRRLAAREGRTPWTDVPTGWNSWGGGGGSGGLGTDLDEALILRNLDAAERDFLPYGMKWFMIDDGWQIADGDWSTNEARFPDHETPDGTLEGMAWLAAQVRARNMIPGIWISPFTVAKDSALAAEHPDWMAQTTGEMGSLGAGFVPGDQYILDLSHPEVLDWLEETFRRITQDWGFRWIKVDFTYFALFNGNLHDPDVTPTEAYVNAISRIREAIGPETFFLLISSTGLGFGIADGNRITLDNEPWWGLPAGVGETGFLVTAATVAHRYWMSHSMMVNHPDLLFFRDTYGLTANEAKTFASLVGLTGGIVKLGETYENMALHPDWREVVYRLLPVYPATARPLDLFEREYPEVWHLPVEREGRSWDVLGLFNWGCNRTVGGEWEPPNPKGVIDEEHERTLTVPFAELGMDPGRRTLAFDAWTHDWRWVEDGQITETLAPRTPRILILHPEPDVPAVAATSEHLLGGAAEIDGERWDPAALRLHFCVRTVPGRDTRVFVMDAGLDLTEAWAGDGVDVDPTPGDGLTTLAFQAMQARTCLDLHFDSAAPIDVPVCPDAVDGETLRDKAEYLEGLAASVHLQDGLLRTVQLNEAGEPVALHNVPSTGLWTAMYLAAQSFRWAVTRDPEAVENARRAAEGLHELTAVTGIPGLYGRSYVRADSPLPYVGDVSSSAHWVASTDPDHAGWYWNDDVSKDTMDGIFFGYAVALELLEDPAILAQVGADARQFARFLVDNDLQIIDHTGEVTEHGYMSYASIDEFPGFNALLVLSWLRTALDVDALPGETGFDLVRFYDDCLLRLGDITGCPEVDIVDLGSYLGTVETLLGLYLPPCLTSFDNFDMVFHAIYPLLRRERRPAIADRLLGVLKGQVWVPPEGTRAPPLHESTHSLYLFLYAALVQPDPHDVTWRAAWTDAICTLHALPADRRDKGVDESTREGVCTNRMGNPNAAEPLPVSQRDYDNYIWRLDPYEISPARAGNPLLLHSPEDFLLAYWVGRYYGFVPPDR